jgi:hypothetical protein
VALSIIATETLVPGAQAQRTEQYVKTYVKSVHDLAKYVAAVDRQRTTFVETEFRQFFEGLTAEQRAVALPMYNRLVGIMTPADRLRRIVIDQNQFPPE